jgi:F-type H+-transporting ATPase subunit c
MVSRDTQSERILQIFKELLMKKIFFLTAALVAAAFGQEGAEVVIAASDSSELIKALSALGGGLAVGIAAIGGAIGMGHAAAATIAGTARNPGLGGKLMGTMILAIALIEAQVIYAMVMAFILFYANPFL